jgi:hypothetical protein
MTQSDIDELRRLHEQATKEPWHAGLDMPACVNNNPDPSLLWSGSQAIGQMGSAWTLKSQDATNASLVAAMRNRLSELLDAAERDLRSGNVADAKQVAEDDTMTIPECPSCGMQTQTPAEVFIHKRLHGTSMNAPPFRLNELPFAFFPLVAELMTDFHDHECDVMSGPDAIEGLTSLLPKYEG